MTLAPSNIHYLFEALKTYLNQNYKVIHANCVYEKGWEPKHATIMYNQMKQLADYILENDLEKTYVSLFDDTIGTAMPCEDNNNWCGGLGQMISCDYKGDIYPCIRYMESSLGPDIKPLIVGNVYDGILTKPEEKELFAEMQSVTRKSQSTDECFNCPIARGCAWCSAYNYQDTGSFNKRAIYICIMHKARTLANVYFWNKLYQKHNLDKTYALNVPKEWALEIISEEEYNFLSELSKEKNK